MIDMDAEQERSDDRQDAKKQRTPLCVFAVIFPRTGSIFTEGNKVNEGPESFPYVVGALREGAAVERLVPARSALTEGSYRCRHTVDPAGFDDLNEQLCCALTTLTS